jgi:CO/xanthine dehydrogenase Mo-binding subunit
MIRSVGTGGVLTPHIMAGMSILGRPQRRIEGRAKVTGDTRYTADLGLQAAHARLVLSLHAHARIRAIDVDAARLMPGVLAVVTGQDLAGVTAAEQDLPLARDRVQYLGQPVAAVVARDVAAAADAAALIEVDYEPLPAVLDPVQAMRQGAAQVLAPEGAHTEEAQAHGGSASSEGTTEPLPPNVTSAPALRRGDVDSALASSQVVVEGRYSIPAVHQGFIEPHVAVARPESDGAFTIWTCTQGIFAARETTAVTLGIPSSHVRVVPMPVGGGFGGKICLLEPLVALLARKAGRAVQLELTRTEEFLMGRGAPGAEVEIKLGASADGTLNALRARMTFDNGAAAGFSAGIAGILLAGTYRVPNFEVVGYEVATNKTPAQAYRAPGAPQSYFALECALDELAERIGVDPIELRLRNASREGDPHPQEGDWPGIGLVECLERARQHPLYRAATAPGEGVGVAVGGWGGAREPAVAACRVEPDGTLTLQLGSVDISGSDTSLAMIAAETFGVSADRVRVETGDTRSAPYAGMAGGSKTVYSSGPAVEQAAAQARRQLLEIAAEEFEAAPEDLVIEAGTVRVSGVPGRSREVGAIASLAMQYASRHLPVHGIGRAAVTAQSPMFTVHLARVRVDAETGAYEVTGYAAIQDVGHALNPPEVVGQIHGGAVQGLGRALGEGFVYDDEGQLRTASFLDYRMPTIDQVPDIDVDLVEIPSPHGPFGAKGVGEPPAVPGPAVIANAIAAATGLRATSLPIEIPTGLPWAR